MNVRNSIALFRSAETKRDTKIIKSQKAIQSLHYDKADEIEACLQETNETIRVCSSLPGHEGNAERVEASRRTIDMNVLNKLGGAAITERMLLRLFAIAIKEEQAGNCYEFSLYCHTLLAKQGTKSEVFRIQGEGNHVFLVIHRDPTTPVNDFTQWNPEAVVVDPFFSSFYLAQEIPTFLQACHFDQELGKVSYHPFDFASHKLNNNVLTELIEDWKLASSVKIGQLKLS